MGKMRLIPVGPLSVCLLIFGLITLAMAWPIRAQTPVTVTYTASTDSFPNPDRGITRMYTYGNNGITNDLTLLNQSDLEGWKNGADSISLIFRHIYLKDFIDSDISAAYLADLATDMATARAAGVKLILRFSYSANNNDDATPVRALGHIDQLAPVLQANEDVISIIQFGFVGQWGEWWDSDEYPGGADPHDRTAAAPLITRLDDALDEADHNISFSLRSPSYRTQIFGVLSEDPNVSAGDISPFGMAVGRAERIGFNNDCLESGSDAYQGFYSAGDRAMEEANGQFTATGGETCFPEGGYSSPTCTDILGYGADFGLDYIGRDWYTTFRSDMVSGGCWDDLLRDLGYRWRLTSATFDDEAIVGEDTDITLNLTNDGFSSIYNNKVVRLVLRSTEDASETYLTLSGLNPRLWTNGAQVLSTTITIPSGLAPGDYDLLLQISDDPTSPPAYAVRLANQGLWEPATGFNDLDHTIQISAVPDGGDGDDDDDGDGEEDEEENLCETMTDLSWSGSDTFAVTISGETACSDYHQKQVTGSVTLGNAILTVGFASEYQPAAEDRFTIISNDGSDDISGTFAGLAEGAQLNIGGVVLQISYRGGDGNDAVLSAVSVPNTPNTGFGSLVVIPALTVLVALLSSSFILLTAKATEKSAGRE